MLTTTIELPGSYNKQNLCAIKPAKINSSVLAIRDKFPIFAKHSDIIFFDNASTTQKPQSVIDIIEDFYTNSCANAGRAAYRWSTQLANAIEEVRQKTAEFLHANIDDIAFTSGATESLNTIALSWGLQNLQDGDEIMLCLKDHKSCVLPWLTLAKTLENFGRHIKVVPFAINDLGTYDLKDIKAKVTEKTRLLAMSHIHHLYGLDMQVSQIRSLLDSVGNDILISLDASQSAGHIPVHVDKLNVDFLSFSGHKIFAANGSGVLWVNPKHKESLHPIKLGGGSSVQITDTNISFDKKSLGKMLEAGTPNIPAILSLRPAFSFIENLGIDVIQEQVSKLTKELYKGLSTINGIDFAPGPGCCNGAGGYSILSFRLEQIKSLDLAFYFDNENIFVRSGDHCIGKQVDGDDYLRVSLHVYNTENEVNHFLDVLKQAVSWNDQVTAY